MRSFALSMTALMVTASLLAACSGNDRDSTGADGAQTFDPTNADGLAHAALLVATDLPGVGWHATDDDTDEASRGLTACNELEAFREDARNVVAGRATRVLARRGSNTGPFVYSEVSIYQDSAKVNDLIKRYKAIDSGSGFLPCWEAQLKELFAGEGRVSIKRVQPTGKAPNGGSSVAVELELAAVGTLNLRSEEYIWASGNAAISVTISAAKTNFSPDLVRAALLTARRAADEAAKSKRQPVTADQAGS